MPKYRVPVDLVFDVSSTEEAKVRADEFMLRAASEHRLDYSIVDYEFPVGYSIEPFSDS